VKLERKQDISFLAARFKFLILGLIIIVLVVIGRMFYLTVLDRSFLLSQGNARSLRTMEIPAYRGMIMDRLGEPLAVSTPVDSIWINPQDFPHDYKTIHLVARKLSLSMRRMRFILRHYKHRQFAYLKRDVQPPLAKSLEELGIPGVYLKREYRRYYPEGETTAHVIGFTNIDDRGQEGLELAYNKWLSGKPGLQRVLKDRYGHVVAVLDDVSAARPGHNLRVSLDHRIQFLAYQVLKETIKRYEAKSGSIVVLNPKNSEILAMVNQPSYNPNNRPSHDYGQFRNRAVTDMFEPGSTMKAFSIASALDSGKYTPDTLVDTNPGWLKVGHNLVYDDNHENHGVLTVTQVLQKSSNIGVAKMTLSLPSEHLLDLLRRVGFGERTKSAFPGESDGTLVDHDQWRPFELATLAFGYGLSVTPLQLAHAYSIIANQGVKCPVSFLVHKKAPECARVMDKNTADAMLHMLETVVQKGGTGTRARVTGYRIAGKTGTAYIAGPHGYYNNKYMASFVGIAPVTNPQLVVAVVIREPRVNYYGGRVAAPAFAKVMSGALRILNIPPDQVNR